MSKNFSNNRILYISYDGMTDALGQSQVIPYMAKLSEQGYQITILSTEKPANYEQRKVLIKEILDKNNIEWQHVMYTKRPPVLSTLFDVLKLNRKAKALQRKNGYGIVHCRSYIAALTGTMLQRRFGLRMVFDMRGFYADERVDGNIWRRSNPVLNQVYLYFKRRERSYFSKADAVVSLTFAGKEEIRKFEIPGFNADNITVIPCCADLGKFDYRCVNPQQVQAMQQKLGISNTDFVFTYLGSLGTWYMVPEMMDFFAVALQQISQARFLIVTHDSEEIIRKLALERNIDQSRITVTSGERNEIPVLLSLGKASVFFIKPVWSKKASSPTKMAEIMGMGIPVIANKGVGDVDFFLEQHRLGIVLEDFSTEAYRQSVKRLLHIESSEQQVAENQREEFRKIALENFSLEEGVNRYRKIYESLLHS